MAVGAGRRRHGYGSIPAPNLPPIYNMARCYAGTVDAWKSTTPVGKGAGPTRPLRVLFGPRPNIDAKAVLTEMHRLAPEWLAGCAIRGNGWSSRTGLIHKHAGNLNAMH